jgi:hypothetical protein
MYKGFWAVIGVIMSMLAAHFALSGDVANTVFTCFASYICYDSMKDGTK